mgnify:CR=1 FL=1
MRLWVVSPLVKGRRSLDLPPTARVKDLRRAVREQLQLRRRILLFWGRRVLDDPEQSLAGLGLRHDCTVSVVATLGSGLIGRLDVSESTDESQEAVPQGSAGPGLPAGSILVPRVLRGRRGALEAPETEQRPSKAQAEGAAAARRRETAQEAAWGKQRRDKGSALAARLLSRQRPRAVVSQAKPTATRCLCRPRPPSDRPCPKCGPKPP